MRVADIPVVSGARPVFGHLAELRDRRFEFFHKLNRECGDIARAIAMGVSVVFVNSPELLHEVLVEKAKSFVKSPGLRGPLKPLAGVGLFTSEGELWKRQRKLMAPLFVQSQMTRWGEMIAETARSLVSALPDGEVFDAARLTTHIAMRVAGSAFFDADTLDEADELGEALTVALQWVNDASGATEYGLQLRLLGLVQQAADRILPAPLAARAEVKLDDFIEPIRWPSERSRRIAPALATIERRVERMIADRRAAPSKRDDLLSLLLEARDEGGRMSDKQVRDEIITLFIAGHETTATGLAWSLYLLCRHPDLMERAEREARAIPGPVLGAADLPNLSFCLQVFKEAMRLYPPIYFFGRQAIADVRIGDYDLPRSTIVLISTYALHHRAEIWPDPERFDPSRFEPEKEAARHRSAYLPFSGGPRTCIGNHFALMEGPLVLATILRERAVELATSSPVEIDTSATLRPKGGMPMRAKRR